MDDKYLEQLEYFFTSDMEIKRLLASIAPSEIDESSEEARIKYFDKLNKAIDTISVKLGRFIDGPFFSEKQFMDYKLVFPKDGERPYTEYLESEVPKSFHSKMEQMKKQLMKCESLRIPLNRTYNACFAHMDNGLIHDIREEIFGDNFGEQQRVSELLGRSTSINEILHILHSHVENNKEILQSLPLLDKKESPTRGNDGSILVGYDTNSLAREIFDRYELPIDSAFAYTVALKDRTMMMVRDTGHALTMQMFEDENGNVKVKYFIPKVTDADIVAHLPVEQQDIDYETQTASGMLIVPRDVAAERICDFINTVPGDMAIFDQYLINRMCDVNGDEEKAIQILREGLISPRNLLLISNLNLTGVNMTEGFKKRVLDMAEEMEKKERKEER